MAHYDDLFSETEPKNSVVRDKGALNPLVDPDEVIAREDQERQFAT
jgi:archaeal cell division control protein 6